MFASMGYYLSCMCQVIQVAYYIKICMISLGAESTETSHDHTNKAFVFRGYIEQNREYAIALEEAFSFSCLIGYLSCVPIISKTLCYTFLYLDRSLSHMLALYV